MPHDRLLAQQRGRAGSRRARSSANRAGSVDTHDLLTLQREAGNRAVGLVVARKGSATGTVQIGKVKIKVTDGNIATWAAGGDVPDSLEVTSQKGTHSPTLEKLSRDHTKIDSLTLTTGVANKEGQLLDLGSLVIEITKARITSYQVDGTTETWTVAKFAEVHRTKTTHKVS